MMFFQGVGEKEQLMLAANRTSVRDAFDQEVARILKRRKRRGIRASRRNVPRARRIAPEGRMRSHIIVFAAKGREDALLSHQIRGGRTRGLGFQRAMHPFMRPVLLGRRGADPLMLDL